MNIDTLPKKIPPVDVIQKVGESVNDATDEDVQKSKTLEDKIETYLVALKNKIENDPDLLKELQKINFGIIPSNKRIKFGMALRSMYTFYHNTPCDELVDDILITITPGHDSSLQKKFTGLRSTFGMSAPKPSFPLVDVVVLPIYLIWSSVTFTTRKTLQIIKLLKLREQKFKDLQTTITNLGISIDQQELDAINQEKLDAINQAKLDELKQSKPNGGGKTSKKRRLKRRTARRRPKK